ncbi:3-deoxy-7-phosphoheptulonate synthase [bacterium]|nr:3-deoxy-7-phosphoheptulonate synthase [bacterium]MBP9809691.1 3-deoxy-7-phosphoheptulonate synthase [bacterium]
MILSLGNASEKVIEKVRQNLLSRGLENTLVKCAKTTLVVITSDADNLPGHIFSQMDGVQKVVRLSNRSPLGKDLAQTIVTLSPASPNSKLVQIGGGLPPVVISGPCAIEGREQIVELAHAVKAAGAVALRGGAYKPRTSAYDFQGLGLDGLKYMKEAGLQAGLPVVSEVVSIEQIEPSSPYLDVFQVGARNMYNYELLKELGRQRKPVLLKRGMSATIDELLQAAEYILLEGNLQVILCERGIRTFENRTRNTLDLSAVAVIKSLTSLPVLVDPSHAVGKRELIAPLSRAAIACGADGLIIESHCTPDKSVSDAAQAIEPSTLAAIVKDTNTIYAALNPSPVVNTSGKELAETITEGPAAGLTDGLTEGPNEGLTEAIATGAIQVAKPSARSLAGAPGS